MTQVDEVVAWIRARGRWVKGSESRLLAQYLDMGRVSEGNGVASTEMGKLEMERCWGEGCQEPWAGDTWEQLGSWVWWSAEGGWRRKFGSWEGSSM